MINLRSEDHRKTLRRLWRLRVLATVSLFIIPISLAGTIFLMPSYLLSEAELQSAQDDRRILEAEGMLAAESTVSTEAERIKSTAQAFSLDHTFLPLEAIAAITEKKPAGVRITRITVEDSSKMSIGVSGTARDRQTLQTFVDRLHENPDVLSIDSPISNFVKSEDGAFRIGVVFKQ